MNEQVERVLAYITIAMPIVVIVLHGARAFTNRLRAYALATPEKWDDVIITRVLRVLDGLDAIVDAIAFVIPKPPRPLNPTPHLEAVEDTSPETPTAKQGER